MFFISLKRITDFDKLLLNRLDKLLLDFYKKNMYFTHVTVSQSLNISKETSYQLLLHAENAGVIGTVEVKKCTSCGNILFKEEICSRCLKTDFENGYYYTASMCY